MENKIAKMKDDIVETLKQIGEGLKYQMKEQGARYDPRIDLGVQDGEGEQSAPKRQPPWNTALGCLKIQDIVAKGKDIATAFEILKSLQFPTMRFRQSKVVDAHPNTFQWMFSTSFVQWLQSS
jgi:hypothetical protein